jgi:outer membrane receptor protein involved in Fe transport
MYLGLILAAGLLAQAEPGADAAAADLTTEILADTGVIAYPAAFFAEARPNSAFDMISRLPGFTFARGEVVRGFAGAGGNVLIDGERPTSKSVTLEDLLRRLPASSVVRIELIRGSAPGIDMQGQALVANVIRSRAASQDLALSAAVRAYSEDGWLGPQVDAEWARRAGDLSLEAGIHHGWTSSPNGGHGGLLKYFPSGALKESGPFLQRRRTGLTSANGSAELTRGEDLFRLNLGVSRSDARPFESVGRFTPAGVSRGELATTERVIEDKLEAGTDYTHVLAPSLTAQVLALQTLGRVRGNVASFQPGSAQTSTNRESSGESIARATVTWRPSSNLSVEGGGEAAFNFLEGHTTVRLNGAPVTLSNANLRVEERRAEGFVTAVWKPTERLSIDAGARVETSTITSTGDTARKRSFLFAKPRLVLSYEPDAASQLRLRLQREVGQLRFRDFVASADLTTGTLSAGNANLEPERSWIIEGAAERRFWGKGAASATFTHEEVQRVVDLIPVGLSDAPGNIGDGARDKINLALTLPLDRLGIRNGLFTAQATWNWSQVIDPVTGQERRISSDNPMGGSFSFSQDIAALSSTWGIDGRFAETRTTYRINEVRTQAEGGIWNAYWNWKPDRTLSVRAELRNMASRERRRLRERYIGSRAANVLNELERETHRFAPLTTLTVRKVF